MRHFIFTLFLLLGFATNSSAQDYSPACIFDTISPNELRVRTYDREISNPYQRGIKEFQIEQRSSTYDSADFNIVFPSLANYSPEDTVTIYITRIDTLAGGWINIWIIDSAGAKRGFLVMFEAGSGGIMGKAYVSLKPDDARIQIYPNPSAHSVRITTVTDEPIEVYDTQGHPVIAGVSNSMLDVSQLPTGQYFARVGNHIKTFVITR
jgi:hypothetical protein